MAGSHRVEVAAVERSDLEDAQPLRDGGHRRIGGAKREVSVGAGVADDHSGAPEAFGEQVLVVAPEVAAAARERAEPLRRPLAGRLRLGLAAGFGEHGGNAVVGQLLDQPL